MDHVRSREKWGSLNLSVPVGIKDRSQVENKPFALGAQFDTSKLAFL